MTTTTSTAIEADRVAPEQEEGAICYHCGLPIPEGTNYRVHILGTSRPMCCKGCEAVAIAIVSAGLEDFYKFRTENASQGEELVPDFIRQTKVYDNPEIQKSFVTPVVGTIREASLILEGITCAACVWLNEQHIAALPGVNHVQINYATHRAKVRWDDGQIQLSDILAGIAHIGYKAYPYDPDRQQKVLDQERKQQLKRLGLAGALGMQVMMIAVALYFGDWGGMETKYRMFFYWISLILTTPVVLYSAQPFYRSAWRDLRQWRVGMDVPVSLGITGAFLASVWATLSGQGHVYYDSVVMFVFFLLTARFFELAGRRRSADATEQLVRMTPTVATRLEEQDGVWVEQSLPVVELQPGDRLRIRPGEVIPTDGVILAGHSSVNESVLTGESLPVNCGPGDTLIGGSMNVEGPLEMRVERIGKETVLSHIQKLLDRALTEKPLITRIADRAASWFVLAVLMLACGVALYWWWVASTRWFEITIAVLVITCPCALSLATPTALTSATGTLARRGFLVTRGHTLETLARATHIIFDKTGTLTAGRIRLLKIHRFSTLDHDRVLQLSASLEKHSEHPIAKALVRAFQGSSLSAVDVQNTPGGGILGTIEGKIYVLGTAQFVRQHCAGAVAEELSQQQINTSNTLVFLAESEVLHAALELGDEIRSDASQLIQKLRNHGLQISLLSGDNPNATRQLARLVAIEDNNALGGLTPAAKLSYVQDLQAKGAIVAMVGDGVNDAPVLARAQVSVAMSSGAQVAMANADMIALSPHLLSLASAFQFARKTQDIIYQNISWAIIYNLLALPAAAVGWIAPWMAALGMSLSSLLVVANALRLTFKKEGQAL